MSIDWIEEEWHKIITEVMTDVDNKIETKIMPGSVRQKYLEQLARDFTAACRKSETWKRVHKRMNDVVQPHIESIRAAFDDRERKNEEYREGQEKTLRKEVETMRNADEQSRRLMLCRHIIDQMLPLDQGIGETRSQVLRSRGLVMAAMMGMTHMGGGSAAADANEFAKKNR